MDKPSVWDQDEPGSLAGCSFEFQPRADLVSTVRRFVHDFYRRTLVDEDLSSRVALALHELLENAVKYGQDGPTQVRVDIQPAGENARIRISTRNQASIENIEALSRAFAELGAAPDPFAHYQTVMRRSAKLLNQSGLGLARIAAEAAMQMSLDRVGDHEIMIRAEAEIPLREIA